MTATGQAIRVHDLVLSAGVPVVNGISFDVERGEAVGIVGESGSGKSLTLRSVISLLPTGVTQTGGSITVQGRVGMVFQDPLTALDPLMPVGRQVAAASRFARGTGRKAARARALELFEQVRLPDPVAKLGAYPHQLSGGQRQRVVIALALATDPEILLCDEPTTALDVTVQKQVLELLGQLREKLGLSMVFVSHDLAVVSTVCTRLIVMKDGQIVETGETLAVLTAPQHPYTQKLLGAVLALPVLGTRAPISPAPGNGTV
ncbi:ABC transporter ATP-binding protein [Cryobacterium arcticum]|uniref:ABC transporter ATP-binding protein n=1 Tax=Cryobacterium arcticum TaxID=670052 RepID=A0A318A7U4_9MICO|nr:ABC transporter ATP-binding protein [Cryobacterium arcticum]PXA73263.1 ABC transporter ATP-binding protein [Cryobacterium arcticum]